jgi:hypothetical protein
MEIGHHTAKRRKMHILSDEELNLFIKARSERLKVKCEVCYEDGWMKGEQMVPPQKMAYRSDNIWCVDCMDQVQDSGHYSERFTSKGKRLRKNQVTIEMIMDALEQDLPKCPQCEVSLSKSSACNELRHCGNLSVCNFCFGLAEEGHFENGCSRWDHESHCNPCTDPLHSQEMEILKSEKRKAAIRVLSKEDLFEEAWKRKCSRQQFRESASTTCENACLKPGRC